MKRTLTVMGLLFVLVVTSVLLTSFASPNAEADGRRGFSVRDIRGDYSVAFDGEITEGPLVGHAVAVGRVRSNGRGNFVFSRTLNVNGMAILPQTGECEYSVNPDGTGAADCTVMTPGQPNARETFAFTIVSTKEVDFVSTTPGAAVLGVGKKQSRRSDDD